MNSQAEAMLKAKQVEGIVRGTIDRVSVPQFSIARNFAKLTLANKTALRTVQKTPLKRYIIPGQTENFITAPFGATDPQVFLKPPYLL